MIWSSRTSHIVAPRRSVPAGTRIYAIGDIHGRLDLLDSVLARIDKDTDVHPPVSNAVRIFLGDYIDRGPDSKRVLDRLVNHCVTHPTVCLMGNHEAFLRQFLINPDVLTVWRNCGGLDTLLSFGLSPKIETNAQDQRELASELDRILPSSHREFLGGLKQYFICGDFFFVHAGVRPGICLTKQSEDDLLWIREDFLSSEDNFGKVVVHGHTPVLEPDVRANRINIDTGAYATGRLTCLVLENDKIRFI
ncbi:metallophosphoesterase family protein [Bradyrhizobium sp.]|uniref:metallophosphoesterase family protein n=1 Tax=Bradyrhizobium sp. TaxID=376 RepID=UPI003C1953E5